MSNTKWNVPDDAICVCLCLNDVELLEINPQILELTAQLFDSKTTNHKIKSILDMFEEREEEEKRMSLVSDKVIRYCELFYFRIIHSYCNTLIPNGVNSSICWWYWTIASIEYNGW